MPDCFLCRAQRSGRTRWADTCGTRKGLKRVFQERGACVYFCGWHPHCEDQGNTLNLGSDPPARRAAIDLAAAHFEDLGYVVDSVEGDNIGWDLEAIHGASGDSFRIEVKGLSGSAICVEMTRQEYEMMRRHKKNYRVCVVTRALVKGARALHVFSYVEATRTWIDDADQPLHIQEVLSARLRAD